MKRAIGSILAVSMMIACVSPVIADPVPTWDKQINGPGRFSVLAAFAHEAVLDKETGLVWQRSPSSDAFNWGFAQYRCTDATTGNRAGWRLPTIQELMSLVDPSVPTPGITLPAGHPFDNVATSFGGPTVFYWAITTSPFFADGSGAYKMNFVFGALSLTTTSKDDAGRAWCVRGGQGVGPQQ